jgi:hypothetical protein
LIKKKFADKDIRFFVFFFSFFVSFGFCRFGLVDFNAVGIMTSSSFGSSFYSDVIMFFCGWISIGLFMWHFAK